MTHRFLSILALAVGVALTPASRALAVEFNTVDADASTLTFRFSQMGVTLDGSFPTFDATLQFDPERPEAARTVIEVPIAAIDTGSEEGDEEARAKTWFHTEAHPTARFESTQVKVLGDNKFEVTGNLTIKGNTREITTPVTYTPADDAATPDGSFTIQRADFAIGEGMWADDEVVALDVTIDFHVVARPHAK